MKKILELSIKFFFISLSLIFSNVAMSTDKLFEPIPAADIFVSDIYFGFKFSPNGDKIMFKKWMPKGNAVVIYNLDKRKITNQFVLPKNVRGQDINWLSNTSLACEHKGMILSFNEDGSNLDILVNNQFESRFQKKDKRFRYWDIRSTLPLDEEHIILESFYNGVASIHEYDIHSGKKTDIIDGKKFAINRWFLDGLGSPRIGEKTKNGKSTYFWVDLDNNFKIAPVITPSGEAMNMDRADPLKYRYTIEAFPLDSRYVYMSDNGLKNKAKLFLVDPKDGAIKGTVLSNVDDSLSWMDSNLIIFTRIDNKKLMGFRWLSDEFKSLWIDPKLELVQKTMDFLEPKNSNRIVLWSTDLRYFLIYSSNSTDNQKVYVYDASTKELLTIYQHAVNRSLYASSEPELVVVDPKGSEEKPPSYLTLPPKPNVPISGAIVIPCPDMFGRHTKEYNPYVQFFSSRNYAVLQLNTKGCTGQGYMNSMTPGRSSLLVSAEELVDASRWIKKELNVEDVFLFAETRYSSYRALKAMDLAPGFFSGISIFATPVDVIADYKFCKNKNYIPDLGFWNSQSADGKYNKKFLKGLSLVSAVEQTQIPMLYAFGELDKSKNADFAKELRKSSKNKNVEVKLIKDTAFLLDEESTKTYYAQQALKLFEKSRSIKDVPLTH